MTVTYTAHVATSSFGRFASLLVRWRGSIYKLLWKEFLTFTLCYYLLSLIYRFALTGESKRLFEKIAMYCEMYNNLIPVAFVLGFYVSIVVNRWWDQFNTIPWPDPMAVFVTAHIHGEDDRSRLMRRTIMRYMCLSYVIVMSCICVPVKKRFPNFQSMTDAGFMQPSEQKVIEDMKTPHNKYFVPLVWSTTLVTRARKEGRIKDDMAVKTLIDELNRFRGCLGCLFNYDWISVPIVYTQVVTLAVYTFFLSCLMGRQYLDPAVTNKTVDLYIPVFTLLQFLFYMGWLKVAESLLNPFGEDDDDFEINSVIDRNLQASYLIVDEMHAEHPELIKDQYWDDTQFDLPYNNLPSSFPKSVYLGSAMELNVGSLKSHASRLESVLEDPESGTPLNQKDHSGRFSFRKATSPISIQTKTRRKDHRKGQASESSSRSSIPSANLPPNPDGGDMFSLKSLKREESKEEVEEGGDHSILSDGTLEGEIVPTALSASDLDELTDVVTSVSKENEKLISTDEVKA